MKKSYLYSLVLTLLLICMCSKKEELSGFVDVGGVKLNYLIEGEGIPCLVVGSTIYYPRTFSQELRQHFKFIFADVRWYVQSETSEEYKGFTLDTILEDIDKIRRTSGFKKIAILGHSIHSLIAIEYALRYPENTSHVIMIGLAPYWNSKAGEAADKYWESDASSERKKLYKENWDKVQEDELAKMSRSDAFIKTYVTDGPKYWYNPAYDCSWLWEGVNLNTAHISHLFGEVFGEYDNSENYYLVSKPVFLAIGKYDYIAPYILWDEKKDKIPNLSYNLFEKSGHTPQLEEQPLFDKKLIEWMTGAK